MFPSFLWCEVSAHRPDPGSVGPYREVAHFLAAGDFRESSNGLFFEWEEKSTVTLGDTRWYRKLDPLTLTSRYAIGLTRPNAVLSLFLAISPFPIIARSLADSVPKVLKRTGREIERTAVRVSLGRLVKDEYGSLADQIDSFEIRLPNGTRAIHSREGGRRLDPVPERLLNLGGESAKMSAADRLKQPGILSLGMSRGGKRVIVNSSLSLEIADVASSLADVASAIDETVKFLSPYIVVGDGA